MNFSHNGGTAKEPIDFPDLEAFGKNNFTIELDDLESVINYLTEEESIKNEININDITLIGHSRGGGIVLLKAREDKRISKVITWAGVSDFAMRFPSGEVLETWKKNGIAYITNARTNQQMPHYFQFYLNFKENENRLTIKNAVQNLQIPYLIVHGSNDETVSLQEAKNLKNWNSKNKLVIIEDANHTFGSVQPWKTNVIPEDLQKTIKHTIQFVNS
jgi:pimeloyl-ACP methyl ester carboxylesterase